MSGVKISVLMAARNAEATLEKAAQSVLAQRGASFELLIGDDASTDGTWDCIRRIRRDLRVRAWRFRRHQGVSVTRNRLIARAAGRYLSICDADDRMLPDNLRRLSAVLDRRPQVGVAYGRILLVDERRKGPPKTSILSTGFLGDWDLLGFSIPNGAAMLRKKLVQRVGGYNPKISFGGDGDLLLRLGEVTQFRDLGGKPVYLYRRRHGSVTDQSRQARKQVAQETLRRTILRRYGVRVTW